MSVLTRSVRRLSPSQLALLTLALAACAAAEEPDDGGNGNGHAGTTAIAGSAGLGVGGSGSVAGSTATTAGTTSAGGKGSGTAGTTSSSGGSTVGTAGTTTAGGTTAAGGTGTTTGGTTTGTCAPYAGTLAKDSAIFTAGFGKSTMGTWSGYGYTYKYGTATIAPGMGNGCFAAAKFCANGSVPADDKSGAGLGWNIAQMMGASTTSKVAIATGVKLTFAGITAGMRAQLSASATVSYCYTFTEAEATAGTATIAAASFKTECWGTAGTAYDGTTPIEAIQIAVPGSTAGAVKPFDFCVLDVEPG